MSRHRSATPSSSADKRPAPADIAAATADAAAAPDAIIVAGASSNAMSHSCLVMSSETTGVLVTRAVDVSTAYSPCGTPSAGTRSSAAGSASATPVTEPRSRDHPASVSPGCGPATRTETGNPDLGPAANGTVSATVSDPSASRDSRCSASREPEPEAEPEPEPEPEAHASSAVVATTALPRNGTGATAPPSASAATAASRYDAPAPPEPSGTSSPAHPTSAATTRHRSPSYVSGDSVRESTLSHPHRSPSTVRRASSRLRSDSL